MPKEESAKTNFIFNVCYQVFILVLPLITAPYISRVLGADNIGIYSYTQAFANYFVLFAMLGVNNYGNREIARTRDDRTTLSKTFWEIYTTQAFLTSVLSICYIVYSVCFVTNNKTIYLIQLFYVISAGMDINWFCYGLEKFKVTVTRSTVVRICTAIAIFVFVKNQSDLWKYTLIMAAGTLIGQIVVWPFVIHRIDFIRPTVKGMLKHVKGNCILFIPVLAVSLYNVMDKLMLGNISTTTEVGFYSYAEKIVQIPIAIIAALGTVLMPRISNLVVAGDNKKSEDLMDKSMLVAMFSSVAFAFGLAAISKPFTIWFYGNDFARCGNYIFLLSPIIIFKSWSAIIRTQYIIPNKKDGIFILSVSTGAIVNLILNALLIPRFDGYGAIVGTFFAELAVCLVQFTRVRKEIKFSTYLKDGLAFCIIGSLMFAGIYWINNLTMPNYEIVVLQVAIGAAIYLAFSIVYMVKIKKEPFIINAVLSMLKIKFRM